MKTALVISFYKSNNLGDLALSKTIDQIIESSEYKLIRYDFSTGPVISQSTVGNKETDVPKPRRLVRNILQFTKRILVVFLGEVNFQFLCGKYFHKTNMETNERYKRDFQEADVVVLCGGNMLMDVIPSWPFLIAKYAKLAQTCRKPFYAMYIGAGPIRSRSGIRVIRQAMSTAVEISARDRASAELCRSLTGTDNVSLTADPVFTLSHGSSSARSYRSRTRKGSAIVGVCVLGEMCFSRTSIYKKYLNALKDLITNLCETDKVEVRVVLFSTEKSDYPSVHRLYAQLIDKAECHVIVSELRNIGDWLELYETLDFLIGGRMHSMILAHTSLLPHIGVIWQEKIVGFGETTRSLDRMYTVSTLASHCEYIANQIRQSCESKELVSQMAEINIQLKDRVKEGNLLF